jgi:hypothetical protein
MYNNILGQYPKAYLDPQQPLTKVTMAVLALLLGA